MDVNRQTFGKEERLRAGRQIARIFETGHSILVFPLRIVWLESDDNQQPAAQAAFSVSRRIFRRAVDRNLLKRRMREAYRLGKASFYKGLGEKKIAVMFIYVSREVLSYKPIGKSVREAMKRIIQQTR